MLQEMAHQLLTPNLVSHTAGLVACEKGNQWEGSLGLLQEMVHHTKDLVSYSVGVSSCEKGK